jgi:hypothetical protein
MGDTTTTEVLARLEALEAELAQLKAQVGHASVATERAQVALDAQRPVEPVTSRRDLLRYGAAALGAAAAGLAARPAEAADGDPVFIGGTHIGTGNTVFLATAPNVGALSGQAVAAIGGGQGVFGLSVAESGTGVFGVASHVSGHAAGVRGESDSPTGFGVYGVSRWGGPAVVGDVRNGSPVTMSPPAVYGLNNHSGFGVYGVSLNGNGVAGASHSPGGAGVIGATIGAGTYAGIFYGPVAVAGHLLVTGAKSAAVPHPDGSHRLLYCVESPESWFEDFGTGQLQCGQADITIDPNFAEVADVAAYHVFVTVYDQPNDLTVSERTPSGFRITAKDRTSSGAFSWRVVAKRKDIVGERLAPVTIPPEPQWPPLPATAEPTTEPVLRDGVRSARD